MSVSIAAWMLTYLVHSTLLLGIAWLACRLVPESRLALRETLWRVALLGGLATASLQLAAGVEPFGGSWSLGTVEAPRAAAGPLPTPAAPLPGIATRPAAVPDAPPMAMRLRLDPRAWLPWLGPAWAAVALSLLALLATSYARLRRLLRDRTDVTDGRLAAFLRRLESRCPPAPRGRLPVRLTRSARLRVPLARGIRRGEICLPSVTLERLPAERQEIVVAHELAHLERRDPLWFALTRALERALFFQPLNALARRELQEISEFRCDDWAVAVTRRPVSLARCLTEVAESALDAAALPVPTLSARKKNLSRRVARLLQRSYPMPSESNPRWLMPSALAALLLFALIAPSISAHSGDLGAGPASALLSVAPMALEAPEEPPSPPRAPEAPEAPEIAEPVSAAEPARPPLPPEPPLAPELADRLVLSEIDLAELNQLTAELGELTAHMNVEIATQVLPEFAVLDVEIDPAWAAGQAALAAHAAESWIVDLDFDEEQAAALREMAARLEETGEVTGAEAARLAEMAERLATGARVSAERRERMQEFRERAREMAESHQRLMTEHRERFERLRQEELEASREAREAIRRELEARRELIERARQERASELRAFDREQRERLRQEMLRARDELREQLRLLDEELERQEREDGPKE